MRDAHTHQRHAVRAQRHNFGTPVLSEWTLSIRWYLRLCAGTREMVRVWTRLCASIGQRSDGSFSARAAVSALKASKCEDSLPVSLSVSQYFLTFGVGVQHAGSDGKGHSRDETTDIR